LRSACPHDVAAPGLTRVVFGGRSAGLRGRMENAAGTFELQLGVATAISLSFYFRARAGEAGRKVVYERRISLIVPVLLANLDESMPSPRSMVTKRFARGLLFWVSKRRCPPCLNPPPARMSGRF
jgi:hypothetical protein